MTQQHVQLKSCFISKTGTGQWNIFHKKVKVAKSYMAGGDPVKSYCLEHSSPLNKVQEKLMNDTLKHPRHPPALFFVYTGCFTTKCNLSKFKYTNVYDHTRKLLGLT